jgi:hypothetical protein
LKDLREERLRSLTETVWGIMEENQSYLTLTPKDIYGT